MQSHQMIDTAMEMAAAHFKCVTEDFTRSENRVLTASADEPFFRMISFGNGTVASTRDTFHGWCCEWFGKVEGIFCFDAPKLVGLGSAMRDFSFIPGEIFDCYLPLGIAAADPVPPVDMTIRCFERDQMSELCQHKHFENALTYGSPGKNLLAVAAYDGSELCAVAGASDYRGMWCVGVDVTPPYRRQGIAAYLVYSLSKSILERDILPVYATWYSNIASRVTALKAGYRPVWVEIGSDEVS